MSDAGYNYVSPDALFAAFGERVTEIAGTPSSFVDPEAASFTGAEAEINGVVVSVLGGSQLLPDAQAEMDAIASEERAAAVTSWECSEPSRDAEAEILEKYEQRFVDENGAAIIEKLAG